MELILLFIARFLTNVLNISANIVIPRFAEMFHFSPTIVGFITSVYFLPYAFMQVFAGPLCRTYGTRRILSVSLIIVALGCVLLAYSNNVAMVFISRFLFGLGCGPVYISAIYYIAQRFSGKKYALLLGILGVVANIGSTCGVAPMRLLVSSLGIRNTFIVFAAVCLVIEVLFLLLTKKEPIKNGQNERALYQVKNGFDIVKNSRIIIAGFVVYAVVCSVYQVYVGMWCTTWAIESFPSKFELAGLLGSFYAFSGMAGNLCSAYIKRKNVSSAKAALNGCWGVVISLLTLIYAHNNDLFWLAIVSVIVQGFFNGHFGIQLFAYFREILDPSKVANVTGLCNFAGSVAVLVFQFSSGALADRFSYSTTVAGICVLLAITSTIFLFAIKKSKQGSSN